MTTAQLSSAECVICGAPIDASNDSEEHIIQNAVGGFLTTRGFICKRCNSETGHDWDAELASQLNGLCHFFAIKRDRGSIPAETVTTTAGETFRLLRDGGFALTRPTVEKKQVSEQMQYRVVARDWNEARNILKGLKRKFPTIDIEAQLALKSTEEQSYPEGMINIPVRIGGLKAGRAIVKSAVAFAQYCRIPSNECRLALDYLRNEKGNPCFGYYHATDLIIGRPHGVPLHCVAIRGNPVTGMLLGYVEYFGFLRMVILLSEVYSSEEISCCHAIDPTTGTELDLAVRLDFSRTDISDIYEYKHCDPNDMMRAANAVFGPGMERKRKREWDNVLTSAVRYGFDNCGAQPGERLTVEHAQTISRLMAQKITPYILNLHRRRPLPPGAKTDFKNTG